MTSLKHRPILISAISGLLWGAIAYWLLSEESTWGRKSDYRWLTLLVGPLIGIVIYFCSRWVYSKALPLRVSWAIVMLYFSSGLLALCIGLADFAHPLRSDNEVWYSFIGMPLSFWYGMTLFPLLWVFFPLAVGNQEIIRNLINRAEQAGGDQPPNRSIV